MRKQTGCIGKATYYCPVRFKQACRAMLLDGNRIADFMIEIGRSNAPAGPLSQICKALPSMGGGITYTAAVNRGPDNILSLSSACLGIFFLQEST